MLPSGYQKLSDPSTGRPYYVNLVTGQTSWTPPSGAAANGGAAPPPPSGGGGGLAANWEERLDPSTGRTFYIDHATKRTTWERPTSGARGGGGGYGATPPSQPSRPTPPRAAQQPSGGSQLKKGWAKDDECFLTGVKFTLVQRKHHCRYCGQIAAKELANWASMDPQFADKGIVHAFEAPRAPELLAFDSPV
ncbi:hypothetical protein EMIHUDRAFT_206260 [Emiliania huxleyi CCMP1516]|uniref:WW domain-containing protein n=2 Tax=Emiliania huxleyi TaxID=2903 RepID=A0A0D3JNQ3_EMIH1|nr:hypothetical protein EMIHUDRAFT_206260 [Emiliania huxleyi CCMP1516]EOD25138.1 hypothetical protein EMIHUDRAFT_206260 [Emiliania huxleyi CCMP1516]|eukprot:XP_005777567.1 hypothetical protein EMIHUDRAFT_206260 [Emiliania huxleyi CCMP1516]